MTAKNELLLKSFDPYAYFSEELPPENSEWGHWVAGLEPEINSEFALYCWWHFSQVLDDFVCWNGQSKCYRDYSDYVGFQASEKGSLSLKGELEHALRMAHVAINSVDGFVQQFKIESKVFELAGDSDKEFIQIFAACSILAFDRGITGLLDKNAKSASEGFIFAFGCVRIVNEYIKDWFGKEIDEKKLRSQMAVTNARKRLEKDPKEVAMRQIEKEHQALKSHQKTRGYLAPFARAMQEKYPVIESTTSIERRIRKLRMKK